ncbi:hypothetical protein C8Q75DRAFT_745620 [Abortiporus biennis]|nr:hypothetical protein C8Q75DRAFT_745620 [Abortiporus biennis]
MVFSFSFNFSVPGIANPFIAPKAPANDRKHAPPIRETITRRRPPSPCFSSSQPLSRKRGWVPAISEPSHAAAIQTSTSGYLDTPAKYRDMAQSNDEDEIEEMVAELPPPKRRRTLAGSIVSTALSAALIGTAVGLTVYRLWRDRGKHPEPILPPPPYEQGEWEPHKSDNRALPAPPTPTMHVTPATPRTRKQRHVAGRRTTQRHRKTPSKSSYNAYTSPGTSSPPRRAPIPQEFGFSQEEADAPLEVDDQMDWMGDRLAQLIEEGKRALGKEVVVMSDAQEDEVDDGSPAWVEEDEPSSSALHASTSYSSLRRSKSRPRNIPIPSYSPPSYATPQTTPAKDKFDLSYSRLSSAAVTPGSVGRSRGLSVDSDSRSFVGSVHREDESQWQTPELRESMEKARVLYRQRQQQLS